MKSLVETSISGSEDPDPDDPSQWILKCCSYIKGVCCSDNIDYCCPSGYVCVNNTKRCQKGVTALAEEGDGDAIKRFLLADDEPDELPMVRMTATTVFGPF